jgi:hypothetical protein
MELMDKAKLQQSKAQVARLLGDPLKMRLAVIFAVTALAVGGIYYPLSGQISDQRQATSTEKGRLQIIQDVEALRHDVAEFRSRLGPKSDTNEWVQYLLGGSRQVGVGVRGMEGREQRPIGPYTAITLTMEVQGTYAQIQSFVEWLEQSDRLLRIDNIRIEKMPGMIVMKITVLGLVQKHA